MKPLVQNKQEVFTFITWHLVYNAGGITGPQRINITASNDKTGIQAVATVHNISAH